MAKAKPAATKVDDATKIDDMEFGLPVPRPEDLHPATDPADFETEQPSADLQPGDVAGQETGSEQEQLAPESVIGAIPRVAIQTLRIPFPMLPADVEIAGYIGTSINMQLVKEDVALWKRFVGALREGHATYVAPGNVIRHVDGTADAVRWLLQQVRMELEDE